MQLAPLLWIFGILAALVSALALLRLGQRHFGWHAEISRKCAHVSMGLTTLSFPWIFHDRWPVVVLAVLAAVTLWAVRTIPTLKSSLGQTLGAVKRASLGELLFPVAVAGVFCMALHDKKAPPGLPVLYLIPVLVLTVADAIGALIGVGYGKVRYRTDDGIKSFEGSLAFFGAAFLCSHTLLLLGTPLGREETLLIALHLALLVTIMEALSWNGLDNLFVPLGSYVLLRMFVGLHAWDLLVRFVAINVLLLALLLWKARTYLRGNALFGVALALYSIWFLGGTAWIWPALVFWIMYTLLCPREDLRQAHAHNAQAVVAVSGAPIFWLLLNALGGMDTFVPYVVSIAAHLSLILFAHFQGLPGRSRLSAWWQAGALGFAFIGLPYTLGHALHPFFEVSIFAPSAAVATPEIGPGLWLRVLACLAGTFGSAGLFWFWQYTLHGSEFCGARWARQGLIPLVFSLLAAAISY